MQARVKATGEIVEVEQENTYRFNDGSFVEAFRDLNTDALYFGRDLDFDIEGKFAVTCLNGIKQGIVHDPDYWTRLEHQAAIAAMQAQIAPNCLDSPEGVACTAYAYAHALVEKMKEEMK